MSLELDEFITVYNNGRLRIIQYKLSKEQKYQAKCNFCGCWYDISSKKVSNIKGMKVGDPTSPITVDYSYSDIFLISECIGCGYTHVHLYKDYSEMYNFTDEYATGICTYFNKAGVTKDIKYKIHDAEYIAKFVIGYIAKTNTWLSYGLNYLDIINKEIKNHNLISVTLVTLIISQIIDDKDELTYELMAGWYSNNLKYLDDEEAQSWKDLVNSVFN